ncbi:MAG: RNA methyltransferase [Thermoproteota archaeon]|jgi:tRNA/rRNA methyltransferase|nr:RNA methyltransferase [Thermoproteota archaeon]
MPLGIVLVEPRHHINVGYVARIMKNFGVSRLLMVNPIYDMEEARRYAMHGYHILETATSTNFEELRRNSRMLVGTTALKASSRLNIVRDTVSPIRLAELIYDIPKKENIYIVFGREASGLMNSELQMCDIVLTNDTGTDYTTMNISHALAIILYEITKRDLQHPTSRVTVRNPKIARRQETEMLIAYAAKAAEMAGYDIHKRPLLDSALKRLLAKSNPTSKEVMLMVSLFRKVNLSIQRR